MKQYDIGIDLGTSSIIIATQQQGVIFHQPSVGAVDTRSNTVIAVGEQALRMVGRAPASIEIIRPLRDGVIQDHRMTNELIIRFINQVCPSRLIRPRVAVCVPAAITGIEADAVVESVMAAGARQVYLVDEPVAAALGAGLDIRTPRGCMVIDIGGGSTDIAVISMGGRVRAASLPVAGNAFDNCIAQYVQEKFSLAIGPLTAEALKSRWPAAPKVSLKGLWRCAAIPGRPTCRPAGLSIPGICMSLCANLRPGLQPPRTTYSKTHRPNLRPMWPKTAFC